MAKKLLKIFTIVSILVILSFNLKKVLAQKFSLSLSPPLTEIIIKPGRSVLVAFNIYNLGDPQILTPLVKSFEPIGNFGNIVLKKELEGPIRFSLDNSEIELEKSFFLKPNEKQQLLLRIRAPEGAPEGDYYYTLVVQSDPAPNNNSLTLGRAKASIGANILVTITNQGNLEIKPSITLFDTLRGLRINKGLKVYESNQPIAVVLILKNQGKNLIKPRGKITLIGNFGEKAEFEIIPQNILGRSQRQLLASPSANLNLKQPTTLTLSGFFVGYYRLTADLDFDAGTKKLFANTSFIALPLKLMVAFVFALILVFVLIKKYLKNQEE